jgi:cyclin-dependent kinase 8/11
MDSKKTVPFQRHQMQKIIDIMGLPTKDKWPLLVSMPEYGNLSSLHAPVQPNGKPAGSKLESWYYSTIGQHSGTSQPASSSLGAEGYKLLAGLLEYDPDKRLTAQQALEHPFFSTGDKVSSNCFEGMKTEYPHRRVSQDDNDIRTGSLPGTKRSGLPDDTLARPSKRMKEN